MDVGIINEVREGVFIPVTEDANLIMAESRIGIGNSAVELHRKLSDKGLNPLYFYPKYEPRILGGVRNGR